MVIEPMAALLSSPMATLAAWDASDLLAATPSIFDAAMPYDAFIASSTAAVSMIFFIVFLHEC